MKIYIDGALPKSCKECEFLVHCDECESWENLCPLFHGGVGYSSPEYLIPGSPITPDNKRHEKCPLVSRPHGEWQQVGEMTYKCTRCGWLKKIGLMPYCENCGADMRKGDLE